MSKKKKKLDKRLIEEKLRELESQTNTRNVKKSQPEIIVQKTSQAGKQEKITPDTSKIVDDKESYIRTDMMRVGIVTLAMVIIFIVLYFINLKSNYILTAGDWIFKLLHVGQI